MTHPTNQTIRGSVPRMATATEAHQHTHIGLALRAHIRSTFAKTGKQPKFVQRRAFILDHWPHVPEHVIDWLITYFF